MKLEQVRQTRDWAKLNKMGLYEDIQGDTEELCEEASNKLNEEFLDFVSERVSVPATELPFDSKKYSWNTNSFLRGIRQAQRRYLVKYFRQHNRKLYYLSIISTLLTTIEFILPLALANYWNLGTSMPLLPKILCFFVSFFVLWFGLRRMIQRIEGRLFSADEMFRENYEFETRWANARQAFNDLKYPQQWADRRYDADFHVEFGPHGKYVTLLDGPEIYNWKSVGKDRFIIIDKSTGKEAALKHDEKLGGFNE